ncbi:MAG: CRISPR-associated protein Cas4 [Deltaproteobacteria bacterium]|nr:CRISPR-associated protein Cas4 [Deltaproteobacteria bacterium]
MYDEDNLIAISALQHMAFCPRQCALIHIEQVWDENRLTAEGRILHEKVHDAGPETRAGVHIARGLRLRSLRVGLSGVADVVEFHPAAGGSGARLPGLDGLWMPYPVEYKRGRPKPDDRDAVQLCAQALCIEEMLGVLIPEGALFYGQPRRRETVVFDKALREETERMALAAHELIAAGRTPAAGPSKRCKSCSLERFCLPRLKTDGAAIADYIGDVLR